MLIGQGGGREPGIAQAFIQASREIGLLGEPVWTLHGAVLHYREVPPARGAGVPVTFHGVWMN